MSLAEGVLIISVIIFLLCILSCSIYTIVINTKKNEGLIKAQIEAGKIKRSDHVITLGYEAINKIIIDLIRIYSQDAVLIGGLSEKKDDELSIIINNTIASVCANVWVAMSEELKTAALFYVTEDHLKREIKNNVRLELVARITVLSRQ